MASSAASGPAPSRPPSPPAAGQKVHDASQIKRDSYTDLAAAKISEMMQSSSLDDAPTQSLLRVAYGILDESIQRETGEIPHRDVCLLRNVVQELEHRLGIQADHIRKQNSIIKSRKDKYRTKINALETLVNGANEENEMTVNRFEQMETEMQEHLTTKADIFQSYMDNQKISIKDIRLSSQSIKQEMFALQMKWRDEICNTGNDLKGIVDAADNYHKVLAENQKLFNKVQELKGNIQVYCRVRPFLPGQDGRATTVDYIGESGEILITNPFKQGKDECRMFKFNKVFNTRASQAQVFSDIKPLIRSVIDGFNVCIFAYGQTGSGKTYTMSGPGTTEEDWGINYRALNELFEISLSRRGFSYEVEIQMIEIYNEQVRDLLSNDVEQKRLEINSSQPNGLVVPDASLHPVKSKSDVLDLMEIGQTKRAVGSTALNESSSRSHSILIVHVRGLCLKTGSISRGVLQLVDLAGSERAERSEAIGDRLKETQHINKSLSALGDVMFALAQKNAHVPYRNSKLTHVLQSSLGGQAKTVMFVQINPDTESFSETMTTLKFAERVSGVELGAARSNKEGKDIKELLEQVSYLKDTISRKDTIIEQLLKDKSKLPSSSTDTNDSSQQIWRLSGAAGSGEAECEDVSNDGCSVAAEMQNAPARIARLFPTKNGQPGNSKPKPWESALKPQGRTKSTGSQLTGGGSSVQPLKKGSQVTGGGSSVKPLKRW